MQLIFNEIDTCNLIAIINSILSATHISYYDLFESLSLIQYILFQVSTICQFFPQSQGYTIYIREYITNCLFHKRMMSPHWNWNCVLLYTKKYTKKWKNYTVYINMSRLQCSNIFVFLDWLLIYVSKNEVYGTCFTFLWTPFVTSRLDYIIHRNRLT